jgi:uncharacterized protein (DUF2147 family)
MTIVRAGLRGFWLLAGWSLLQGCAVAADVAADRILGVWLTEGRDSKVEISRQGETYSGKVVWLAQPEHGGAPVRDGKNANPALRNRPIMELEILSGFVRDASGRWRGGQVYSPRQGRSYPAELALAGDDRLEITVRAGILSKQVVWTR